KNERVQGLWAALTGDKITQAPGWAAYKAGLKRRNDFVHWAAPVSEEQAESSSPLPSRSWVTSSVSWSRRSRQTRRSDQTTNTEMRKGDCPVRTAQSPGMLIGLTTVEWATVLSSGFTAIAALAAWATVVFGWRAHRETLRPNVSAGFLDNIVTGAQ